MPAELRSLHAGVARRLLLHAAARWCCSTLPVSAYHSIGGGLPEWQISKSISFVSFARIESNFLQYTVDTDAKMMDQNFEIRIVIFEIFLKFSKRRHAVPLRRSGPLWSRPN